MSHISFCRSNRRSFALGRQSSRRERNSLVHSSASRYPKLAFPGEAGKVGFFKAPWVIFEKIVDAEAMMAFGRQFIRQMRSDKSGNPRHE